MLACLAALAATPVVRMEFRLSGRGTVWIDDAGLTLEAVSPAPPETTITSGPADGTSVPLGPVDFSFTTDKFGSGFQCSLDGAAFASCSSPKVYSALAPGPHAIWRWLLQLRSAD